MMDPHYYEKQVTYLWERVKSTKEEIVALQQSIETGAHYRINRPLIVGEREALAEKIKTLNQAIVEMEATIADYIKKGEQNGELFVKHIPS
jgi:prefoldin subunit 5